MDWDEREMLAIKPCVRCGACCKVGPCGFGYWDEIRSQCGYLIEFGSLCSGEVHTYLCSIADEIQKNPTSAISPAFGSGCCRGMFNADRQRVVRALREVVVDIGEEVDAIEVQR